MLIGYGTKMGLAPMHTWLPDAHSEAPSPVSALLSGALLNCAFLGIFKTHSLMVRAGLEWYSGGVLTVFGLISLWISAIFILQQDNYKRLLAYSSIENMGIIAFGIGIGGISAYGALLHLIHHSLIKSSLFLSAGNILLGFNSKKIHSVGKMPELMPKTFASLMGGFFAISGFPPFGIFLSELLIILGAFQKTAYLRAVFFLFGLFLVFAGMSKAMIRLSFGNFPGSIALKEKWALVISPYILIAASVFLLFYMPDALFQTIRDALSCIGVTININV
jgi:hydrogenase-4 component F